MKNSNFITPIKPSRQKEFSHWFLFSSISTISLFLLIIFLQIPQLYLFIKTKREYVLLHTKTTLFEKNITSRRTLKEHAELLQKKIEKCDHYYQQIKNPYALIRACTDVCKNGVAMQSITVSKKNIILMYVCTYQHEALALVDQLAIVPFMKNIQLTSLKKTTTGMVCTLEGSLSFL